MGDSQLRTIKYFTAYVTLHNKISSISCEFGNSSRPLMYNKASRNSVVATGEWPDNIGTGRVWTHISLCKPRYGDCWVGKTFLIKADNVEKAWSVLTSFLKKVKK